VELAGQARIEALGHRRGERQGPELGQRAAHGLELVGGHLGLESCVIHVR